MEKKATLLISAFLCTFLLVSTSLWALRPPRGNFTETKGKLPRDDKVKYTLVNINSVAAWIGWDGMSGHNPITYQSGVWYPRGTGSVIYQDGIVWGGYSQDGQTPSLRVGGQTYVVGTRSGRIISIGNPQDPNDPDVRIYRIRSDWQTVSDAELRLDAAEFFGIDPSQVTQNQIDQIRTQYGIDWNEWPGQYGAPYYDLNDNDQWDPGVDEPGLKDADQVVWFVCNDLDSTATHNLYGSPPIGIELQVTLWGYNSPGIVGQMTFRRYRFINKSGYAIDSMFVSQWSDPDLGDYSDDFVGCDTLLNLGYVYNAYTHDSEFDNYGLAPPSVGYDFLQGPIVPSPGDTAIFNFKRIPDYKNMPMTSFSWFAAGSPISDPVLGHYDGTLQWYNMMKGFTPTTDLNNPTPYLIGSGPGQGTPTKFPLAGDPVLQTGDLDGQGDNYPPGDRRMVLTSGPFNMQYGDTQEVVVGFLGGLGADNILSVAEIKNNDSYLQNLYNTLFTVTPVPFSHHVTYLNPGQSKVHFRAASTNATTIELSIYRAGGSLIQTLALFDDGQHGDGAAGDGVWGNDWLTSPYPKPLHADAYVVYTNGNDFNWQGVIQNLTTAGPVKISQFLLGSDNLNHNGIANPGENIRYTVEVSNQSNFTFNDVLLKPIYALESEFVTNFSAPNGYQHIPSLAGTYSWPYSPDSVYYQLDIFSSFPANDSMHIVFELRDSVQNIWYDTTAVFVEDFPYQPQTYLMDHIAGNAYGTLGYILVDPTQLTGHDYQVNFNDTSLTGQPLYRLKDMTTNTVLLLGQPYPDEYGHNSQLVDGFVIARGTTQLYSSPESWEWISNGPRWLTGVNWGAALFFGSIDFGRNFFGSTLSDNEYNSVKIVFDSSLTTNCAVYRRDMGYLYAGIGTFNGAAYDISDSLNPRRVNIAFVEDNSLKPADMVWNPVDSVLGGREYFYVMDSDYDSVTAGGYDNSNWALAADVVWAGWLQLRPGYSFLESPAKFSLFMNAGIDTGNVFTFTPQWSGISGEDVKAVDWELEQNYPNPFNPVTQIRFGLKTAAEVKLEIFNVLGQRVKTLVDKRMPAGHYKVRWNGQNDAGNRLGSGIYFYRIVAGDYVKTRKMILLK